ncbi:MAG: type I restriction enzyme HsdR N-terminal domain-containing protein [Saccharolobus sp.]
MNSIKELVTKYDRESYLIQYKFYTYTEDDVKFVYIEPLLEALGWDVKNVNEVKRGVITRVGKVDYILYINKEPKVVIIVKNFNDNLDNYVGQVNTYLRELNVEWVVVTNFAETRMYYRNSYTSVLKYNEYVSKFEPDLHGIHEVFA